MTYKDKASCGSSPPCRASSTILYLFGVSLRYQMRCQLDVVTRSLPYEKIKMSLTCQIRWHVITRIIACHLIWHVIHQNDISFDLVVSHSTCDHIELLAKELMSPLFGTLESLDERHLTYDIGVSPNRYRKGIDTSMPSYLSICSLNACIPGMGWLRLVGSLKW